MSTRVVSYDYQWENNQKCNCGCKPTNALATTGSLSGNLTSGSITGKLTKTESLIGQLSVYDDSHQKKFNPYTGQYEIDPKWVEQELETTNLYMTENVKVHSIRIERVSNVQGGRTVTIGG